MNGMTLNQARYDAVTTEARQRANERLFSRLAEEGAVRGDAAFGTAFARSLEFQFAEALREMRPPNNAFNHHVIVSDVPIGARSYTTTMFTHLGRPTWYRGGMRSIPMADVEGRQETRPVSDLILGYTFDQLEMESERFASANSPVAIPAIREKQAAVMLGHQQEVNRLTYEGDTQVDLYGVLNHPWIPRRDMAVQWGSTAQVDKENLLESLRRLFHSPSELSRQTFAPDSMELPLGLYNFLSFTRESEANGDTMLEVLRRNLPGLRNIYPAHELDGAGPEGQDVVICYRRSRESLCVEVSRLHVMLPANNQGHYTEIAHLTTLGGVLARYPLNNVIGYIGRA